MNTVNMVLYDDTIVITLKICLSQKKFFIIPALLEMHCLVFVNKLILYSKE